MERVTTYPPRTSKIVRAVLIKANPAPCNPRASTRNTPQVTVTSAGGPVTGANIANVATGTPITVQVVVQFDPVRWINGLTLLDGRALTKSTVTRRE